MMRVAQFCLLFASFLIAMSNNSSTQVTAIRICGRSLAEALAVVCDARGYNMAFRSGSSTSSSAGATATATTPDRRYRRGIVDECCHNWCPLTTLESYCREEEVSTPNPPKPELQISKRSNSPKSMLSDYFSGQEPDNHAFQEVVKKLAYEHNDLQRTWSNDNIDIKNDGTRHHKRKLFGHTDEEQGGRERFFYPVSMDHRMKHKVTGGIKVKRNDMRTSIDHAHRFHSGSNSNEEYSNKSQEDLIAPHHHATVRHHRDRFGIEHKHRGNDLRKAKEMPTPQVGSISPYFLGRTLVSKSSRKSLHH